VVEDGDGAVAGKDEVAVHTVDEVDGIAIGGTGRGDGQLCCCEGLGDNCPAVDTAGTGGMPERTGVSEDILAEVSQTVDELGEVIRPTGPISLNVVSSRTFSMADLLGSTRGGFTRVAEVFFIVG